MASSDSSGSEDSLAKEMTASLLRGKAGGAGEGGGEEEEEKESEKKDNNLVSTKTEKEKNNNNNNIATSNIPHGARRLVKRRKVVNDGKDAGAGKSGDGVRASSVSECEHPAFMFGICVHCGQRATANARDGGDEERREESGANAKTAVRYLHEGLTVSDKLLKEAKSEERMATLKQGKLFLVLDLDHTLLNSCRFDELNDEERESLDRKVRRGRRRTS